MKVKTCQLSAITVTPAVSAARLNTDSMGITLGPNVAALAVQLI